jgi:hypothetical protein
MAQDARADVTYSYTGAPFTYFDGGYSCSGGVGECAISVTFTLAAPLAPNVSPDQIVTPLSWSVSDGVNTITNATPDLNVVRFEFSTGPDSSITSWIVEANSDVPLSDGSGFSIETLFTDELADKTLFAIDGPGYPLDTDLDDAGGTPGTWRITSTPESGTTGLLMLGLGLLALATCHTAVRNSAVMPR